ncbi:MAG: hypothetical protein LUC26_05435 [Prevotella sp.]|nr:hypothetical protein [Prevotella sp.]
MKTIKFLALLMCLCLSTLTVKAQDETGGSGDDTETSATDTSTAKSYTLGGGYNSSVGGTGEVALSFSAQYGEFDLCNKTVDPAVYSGYRIVCSDPVNVQVKVVYEDDTRYPTLNDGNNSYTFETNLGNVTNIGVYCNDSGGTGSVTIKEAYLVLASTGEEEMTNSSGTNSWSYSVDATVESSATKYIFSQQYGQYALSDKEEISLSDYTGVKVNCSDVNDVQLKVVYSDNSTEKYATLKDGETTYTFETDLGNVTLVVLQANGADGGSIILNSAYLVKAGEAETEGMTYDLTNNTQNCTYSEGVTSGETSLSFSAQWGQFSLCNKSEIDITEYSGFKVTCSNPNNVQLKVSFTAGDDSYPQFDEDGVCSYTFPTDRGNVTLIAVQAKEDEASVTITSAYLVKASETEEMSNAENSNSYWYTTEPVVTTGAATYTFSAQYGQYALSDKEEIDLSEYTGVKVNCSDVNDVQLKVVYSDNSTEKYVTLNDGETTYTFETDLGNVTLVALQAKGSDGGSITLNSAYLIKAASESSEETMIYKGVSASNPQCTANYPENSVSAVTFSALWGSAYLMEDDNTYATFTYGDGKTVYYTISFAEPTSQKLWVEMDYLDDSNNFTNSNIGFEIAANSTTYSFTISDEVLGTVAKSIDGIKIEANDQDTSIYPFTVYIASITSTESEIDALLSVNNLGSASFNATYNGSTRTITYSDTYGGCGWWFGDQDLSAYAGVEVAFKTATTDYIQLVVQYLNENSRNSSKTDTITASSATTGWGKMTDGKTLYVPFNDYAARVMQIYVQNGKTADAQIKIVGARLIEKAVEGQAYTYEMNLSGYALANWQKSTTSDESDSATTSSNEGGSGTIEVDDEAGTATLTFAEDFGGLGWKNWSEAIANVGKWNLAQFDRVEISYTADDSEWDTNEQYFELFTQLNDYESGDLKSIIAKNSSSSTGVITLPITDTGTYTDADDVTVEGDNIDWTGCGQLVILASKADMAITVTGIKFIRDAYTVDSSGGTYNLSTGDVSLPKVGSSSANIYVYGDGSTEGHTIKFQLNSSGTYNIYLEDATINTTNTALTSGIAIPRGVTVNLYVAGDSLAQLGESTNTYTPTEYKSYIKGSTYGIRSGLGSTLKINLDKNTTLYVGTVSESDDSPSKYGLYFLGTEFQTENSNPDSTIFPWGTSLYVTGVWCGIYLGEDLTAETNLKGTNMYVTATGDSSSSVGDDMPTWTDPDHSEAGPVTDDSGNVIHYVCAIYSKCNNKQIDISDGSFVISATGTDTYGIYSSVSQSGGGNAIYVGWCYLEVTATKCVLHRVDDGYYNQALIQSEEAPTISLNGPFCAHYSYTQNWDQSASDYGTNYYWYCDGTSWGSSVFASIQTNVLLDDYHAATSGYPYTTSSFQPIEIEYVNRKLYTGWNTISLPFDYNLNPNDTVDVDDYSDPYTSTKEVEARQIISYYATFDNITPTKDDDGVVTYTFTPTSTKPTDGNESSTDLKLSHDVAYLVYVDPATYGKTSSTGTEGDDGNDEPAEADADVDDNDASDEVETTIQADEDGAIEVMFTMQNYPTLYGQENGDDASTADELKVVFTPMTLYSTEEDGGDKYKLIRRTDNSTYGFTNYFNLPATHVTLPGYRAYLESESAGGAEVKLSAIFSDDTEDDMSTTGITEVADVDKDPVVDVYGVDGKLIRIAKESVATSGLTKGVYIVGGKKVAVK